MIFNANYDVKEVIADVLLKRAADIEKYVLTIKNVQSTNVAQDRGYQKNFNGFYKMRQRSAEWYESYYEVFEIAKRNSYSFENILTELYKRTGRIEPSFTSKMVATLNPDMPIWDKFVLQNLTLKLKGTKKETRLKNAVELYYAIVEWYRVFLNTDRANQWIQEFDRTFSDYAWYTPTKKVDFILWSMRESKSDTGY